MDDAAGLSERPFVPLFIAAKESFAANRWRCGGGSETTGTLRAGMSGTLGEI